MAGSDGFGSLTLYEIDNGWWFVPNELNEFTVSPRNTRLEKQVHVPCCKLQPRRVAFVCVCERISIARNPSVT